jgi:hypothetical protein
MKREGGRGGGGLVQPHTVPHDICESEKIALKLDRNKKRKMVNRKVEE